MKKYKTTYLIKIWFKALPQTFIDDMIFLTSNRYPELKKDWRNAVKYTMITGFLLILVTGIMGNISYFGYPKDDFVLFCFIGNGIIMFIYKVYISYQIWYINFKKILEEEEKKRKMKKNIFDLLHGLMLGVSVLIGMLISFSINKMFNVDSNIMLAVLFLIYIAGSFLLIFAYFYYLKVAYKFFEPSYLIIGFIFIALASLYINFKEINFPTNISPKQQIEQKSKAEETKESFQSGNLSTKISILKSANKTKEQTYDYLIGYYKFKDLVKDGNETFEKIYDEAK